MITHYYSKPDKRPAIVVVSATLITAFFYTWFTFSKSIAPDVAWWGLILIGLKTIIEICSLFFGFSFLAIGFLFLFSKPSPNKKVKASPLVEFEKLPAVGIIYLCYNDADREALLSIATLNYPGKLHVIIHDDSNKFASQADVDLLAEEMKSMNPRLLIRVLRRPEKKGGKAGAVNYVLQQTAKDYEYFILCDNDSTFLNPGTVQDALNSFTNDKIAIAQFRIIGLDSAENCTANRYLRKCIDAFHVFMTVFSRYGWQAFIGHNAMLRTSSVMEVEGFTPGFFSDDLDMTVRLNLKGYKVTYAEEIVMGEKHPPPVTIHSGPEHTNGLMAACSLQGRICVTFL